MVLGVLIEKPNMLLVRKGDVVVVVVNDIFAFV